MPTRETNFRGSRQKPNILYDLLIIYILHSQISNDVLHKIYKLMTVLFHSFCKKKKRFIICITGIRAECGCFCRHSLVCTTELLPGPLDKPRFGIRQDFLHFKHGAVLGNFTPNTVAQHSDGWISKVDHVGVCSLPNTYLPSCVQRPVS